MLCVLSQRSDRLLSTRHTHSQKTLGATRNREVGVHSDAHGVVVLVRRRQAVRRREVAALADAGEELAVGGARGDGALVRGLRAAAALAQLEDAAADEARRAAADDRRGDDDEREPEGLTGFGWTGFGVSSSASSSFSSSSSFFFCLSSPCTHRAL